MEKELDLTEVKKRVCNLLVTFSECCKTHNLHYFLSNGTLLGAIKYKGFIPWDDDIDVLMPRKDYDVFIEIFKDSTQYKLFTRERNPRYKFPYAKLCDMTTLKIEQNIDNGIALGLDIDIFPLDCCSEHILRPNIQRKLCMCQKGCILSKFVSSKGKSCYKRLIIEGCKVLGFDFFCHRLSKLVRKEISIGNKYMGSLMWPIYGKREIIPAEVFADAIEVEFEGSKFPAPIGYDTYLRSLYGDYEEDPPIEKQKSHHSYTAYQK